MLTFLTRSRTFDQLGYCECCIYCTLDMKSTNSASSETRTNPMLRALAGLSDLSAKKLQVFEDLAEIGFDDSNLYEAGHYHFAIGLLKISQKPSASTKALQHLSLAKSCFENGNWLREARCVDAVLAKHGRKTTSTMKFRVCWKSGFVKSGRVFTVGLQRTLKPGLVCIATK